MGGLIFGDSISKGSPINQGPGINPWGISGIPCHRRLKPYLSKGLYGQNPLQEV